MNDTIADEPSNSDENSVAEDSNDPQVPSGADGETSGHDAQSNGPTSEQREASEPHEPAESSEAQEVSETSESSEAESSEASEPSEASEVSETSEVSEASEASDAGAPDEVSEAAGISEVDDELADEEPDDSLDGLFLSPDDDNEGVIEVDYQEIADEDGTLEVHSDELRELEDQITQLNERVEQAEKERGEFKERWMRAAADLENLRKRAKREKEEQRKYGNDKIVLELLPAVDNLERALAHAETNENESSIVDGVKMVCRQLLSGFEKHGITDFEAKGEKFNPEQHEAIQQVETTEFDTGTVVEQYQKGYFIHDRLLRPALVSVAKRVDGGDNGAQSELSEASNSSDAESSELESSEPESSDAKASDAKASDVEASDVEASEDGEPDANE